MTAAPGQPHSCDNCCGIAPETCAFNPAAEWRISTSQPAPAVPGDATTGERQAGLLWEPYPGADPRGHWRQANYAWVTGRPTEGGVSTSMVFVDRVDDSYDFEHTWPLAERIAALLNEPDAERVEAAHQRMHRAQGGECIEAITGGVRCDFKLWAYAALDVDDPTDSQTDAGRQQ